jgi:bifunctional ADP-heptose synthase (sugar kinase/adenylyltransferase)
MGRQAAKRIEHYFLARNRSGESDEMPWLRIPGLAKLELPRPVVLINGGFDLLTVSHLRLISAARDHATSLVCALDSDAKLKRTKGPSRPIMTFVERATALGYTPIDYLVEVDTDSEFRRLIAALKPDLRVQGIEYRDKPTRFPSIPKMFVRSGLHTSEVIDRIVKQHTTEN